MYRLALTTKILEEMQHALEEKLGRTRQQTDYLIGDIRRSFEGNLIDGYEGLIPSMQNDEKDRHVLAAAVRGGVETIVTLNIKDFPASACSPYGVEAQQPDTFLLELWNRDPETMMHILEEQASDLQGWTVQRLLDRLGKYAPQFGETVVASGFMRLRES